MRIQRVVFVVSEDALTQAATADFVVFSVSPNRAMRLSKMCGYLRAWLPMSIKARCPMMAQGAMRSGAGP